MTSVKNQGPAGTCSEHATVGTLESQINLYYNQHYDINLSEQMYADCINEPSLPIGMNDFFYPECTGDNHCSPGYRYCVTNIHGVADESCDPYASRGIYPSHCDLNYICSNWQERTWKTSDFYDYKFFNDRGTPNCPKQTMNLSTEDFKKVLVAKGPLDSAIMSWNHSMVLVGYRGQSDWKTIDHCDWTQYCKQSTGCTSKYCSVPGEETQVCANDFNSTQYPSSTYRYKCEPSRSLDGKYEWTKLVGYPSPCPTNQRCANDQCASVTNFNFTSGQKECTLYQSESGYFREYSEYAPGQGDTYWIFKNSWGDDWGEQGYARIDVSLGNLGWASLPLGPFIPPTDHSYWPPGFDSQIKCVDKDNDGYCNWGISETKPSTCPATCKPQKDCDDSKPNLGPFDENMNCSVIAGSTPTPRATPTNCLPTPKAGYKVVLKAPKQGFSSDCVYSEYHVDPERYGGCGSDPSGVCRLERQEKSCR